MQPKLSPSDQVDRSQVCADYKTEFELLVSKGEMSSEYGEHLKECMGCGCTAEAVMNVQLQAFQNLANMIREQQEKS